MEPQKRRELIEHYKQGLPAVLSAIEGISEEEWDFRPSAGEWSPREVVHHLAGGEMISAVRLLRLLAEDSPEIPGYDEVEYARRLHYDRPVEASLEAFRGARQTTAELLDRLTEEEWRREGTHTEFDGYNVEFWLERSAAHPHQHAEQITNVRAARKG